jgi:8-oxo-dGTP pyrophosphatase MutT (NUDIX family)
MKDIFAAVTIITFENNEVLILKRTINPLDPWSGHLSLPGGRVDKEDIDLRATAERETLEECNILLTQKDFIRELPVEEAGMAIGKAVKVLPFHFNLSEKPNITLELKEHDEYYWVSQDYLCNPQNHTMKHLSKDNPQMLFPCIDIAGTPLWGFTYKVLSDFYQWVEK